MKKATRTYQGYQELEKEAYKLYRPFKPCAWSVIQSAVQNADDTMLEEGHHSWHTDEHLNYVWTSVFFASLESLLADGVDTRVGKWFERRGIHG